MHEMNAGQEGHDGPIEAQFLAVVPDAPHVDRLQFVRALQGLKARSPMSYASLARRTRRPVSTIHGWITGRHLPYARDNDDFAGILRLLGADDVDAWMEALFELRFHHGADATSAAIGDVPSVSLSVVDDESHRHDVTTRRLIKLVEHRINAVRPTAAAGTRSRPVVVTGPNSAATTSTLQSGLISFFEDGFHTVDDEEQPEVSYLDGGRGVEWGAIEHNDAERGRRTPCCRLIVVDRFETLLTPSADPTVHGVLDELARRCDEPRTAVVVGVHNDALGAAVGLPLLRCGMEEGIVAIDAPETAHVAD